MEVYRIGVQIAMQNGVSGVLHLIERDLLGVRRGAGMTEDALRRLKIGAIGAAAAIGGIAVLKGMWGLVDAGKDFVHQQSLMREAGIGQVDIANATAAAWAAASKVIGTSATDNIKLIADLRNVLGDMGEAITAMPDIAKVNAVIANVSGRPAEDAGYNFAKFLELRGSLINRETHQIDPARLQAEAKMGEAIIVGMRNRVSAESLLAFQQQARAAGSMLSDTGLMNLVPLIGAMGGNRTGTFLASLQQYLTGG